MKEKKTLLEQILERRVKPSPVTSLGERDVQEGEVVVAWLFGKIDSSEAIPALGIKSTSQIHQRVGTILRNLAKAGYISITWTTENPSETEGVSNSYQL